MIKRVLSLVLALMLLSVPALAAPSSWAKLEVENAIKAGLVPERIQDNYQQAITREEFCEAVMLLFESLGGKTQASENPFTDTQNPKVAEAFSAKIVEGIGEGLFAPGNNITRQEICTMLKRCVVSAKPDAYVSESFPNFFPDEGDIADWAIDGVKYINMLEVMLGDEAARINPLQNTTREQAILLIYRLYNVFVESFDWISAYYGFVTSGNTSGNMINGSFAIVTLDGTLYISDNDGIKVFEGGAAKTVSSEKANAIYPETNKTVYYISDRDSRIYKLTPDGETVPVTANASDGFLVSGSDLYYRDATDGSIYAENISSGNAAKKVADGPCSLPIPSGNTLYYADGTGIVAMDIASGNKNYIYKGAAYNIAYNNSTFYFTNQNGHLFSMSNKEGSKPSELIYGKIEKYCIYDGAVLYAANSSLFKRDLAGRFTIKLGDYNGESFNSYKGTVFIKDGSGKIFEFNPKTLEKTPLN